MKRKVFINLPVKDIKRSMDFFTGLGYQFNAQFADEKAACMVISDNIYAMLLTEEYFKTFTKKSVSNAKTSTEVLIALDADSREDVQKIITKAKESGAAIYADPQDQGWMYQHSFADLDGHQWEFVYMDESKMPGDLRK